jgi:hypothetical protein
VGDSGHFLGNSGEKILQNLAKKMSVFLNLPIYKNKQLASTVIS